MELAAAHHPLPPPVAVPITVFGRDSDLSGLRRQNGQARCPARVASRTSVLGMFAVSVMQRNTSDMNSRSNWLSPVLATTFTVSLFVAPALSADAWHEADYRDALCAGMKMEVRLSPQSRADCVSDTHAIEVEWADKFKEGVGQALVYSTQSTLVPGLILVCRRDEASCLAASLTSQETFGAFGIRATVWECGADARSLSDCIPREICADNAC